MTLQDLIDFAHAEERDPESIELLWRDSFGYLYEVTIEEGDRYNRESSFIFKQYKAL